MSLAQTSTPAVGDPATEDPAGTRGHHFTVDVEEYFHVTALEPVVCRSSWGTRESRVCESVDEILGVLARSGARGTFFVLGWLAERRPELVRRIAAAGHEIASHGWDHRRVTELTPEEFRASARDSKRLLEDLTGTGVIGFRAPSFSIVPGREWALDVLVEEGYRYDSSIFPIRRPGYGYPGAARRPHWLRCPAGPIAEFPLTTLRRFGRNLPTAGGAYFRLFPYALTREALRSCEEAGFPGTFYLHPWEIDPGQPRLKVPWTTRIRHYGGLGRCAERLRRLVAEFRFPRTLATSLEAL